MELSRSLRFIVEKDPYIFLKSTNIVEVEPKESLRFSILGKVFFVAFCLGSFTSLILGMSTLFLKKDISACPDKCWIILEILGFEKLG